MLKSVEIWNALVALRRPSLGDVERVSGCVTRQILITTDSVRLVGSNVCVELPHVRTATELAREPVANLTLLTTAAPFAVPILEGIAFSEISQVTWLSIDLQVTAEVFRKESRKRTGGKVGLVTESDIYGRPVRWKVSFGALLFEFVPLGTEHPTPESARMKRVLFSYGLADGLTIDPRLELKHAT